MFTFDTFKGCVVALSLAASPHVSAELFEGCPSGPIMEKFSEFGKTGKMPLELGQWLNSPEGQAIEPWKPFDNVDYVGICWVSAWLIHTDDGIVLIDTLYAPFTSQLVENIKSVGVDLNDINYVLMTHGHFDHAGGANELKPLLPNATFVMTKTGWEEARKSAAAAQGRRAWQMLDTDMVVKDGDTIEVGGMSIGVLETPGHTWGTASYTYDVKDGEKTYRAITIGGLGLNAIEGPDQVEAYIASVDRIQSLVDGGGDSIDVHLTTHGFSNNLQENRFINEKRESGAPNIFVDSEGILKQTASLREGAVERLEKEKAK